MRAFYNEIDAYCCGWLSNLMDAGMITPGDICDKSIEDVFPDELRGYDRCHFFAGIGTWDYALNLAGWGERPVWTGSAPCQPFSQAGKGAGFADERHLWPYWQWLISECRPAVIFGEQVASSNVDAWIDLVQPDMEALDFAYGCVPFPSASVGAPHIRDRTFFVAYANDARSQGRRRVRERAAECIARASGVAGGLANTDLRVSGQGCAIDGRRDSRGDALAWAGLGGGGLSVALADDDDGCGALPRRRVLDAEHHLESRSGSGEELPGPTNGFWRTADWLLCRDGKWRPVEPGSQPLVNGAPSRVGRLRAYGNTINPWQAREFIRAAEEARLSA
jgi:DNA (cytosine-5)-methyltransferase 1